MAFVLPIAGQPLRESLVAHATEVPSCIAYPEVEDGSTFEIQHHMLEILPSFHNLSTDDPNMHLTEFLMGWKNILGQNLTTKTLVNASCGGTYSYKNALQAYQLFENMVIESQQWAVDLHQTRGIFEMSSGSPHVSAQIEKMEKKLENFDSKFDMLLQRMAAPMQQIANQQPTAAACTICGITTHDFIGCPHRDAYPEHVTEKINAFNNYQRPKNDLYSNFYNPGWRDHPNFKWDRDQQKMQKTVLELHGPVQPQTCSEISAKSANPLDRSENTVVPTVEIAKKSERVYVPPMPYLERLNPHAKDQQLAYFMKTLAKVQINLPLIEAIKNIPSSAKFLKDVCTKKKKLQIFVVLDMDEDMQTPIILGRPFMATARTLIDVEARTLTLRVHEQSVVFNLFEATKRPSDMQDCMRVDVLEGIMHAYIVPLLTADTLLKVLHGFEDTQIEDEEAFEYVTALESVPLHQPKWRHIFESLGDPKRPL
ncbi:unnamed protein product [Malus baccata var. baccata]